MEIKGSIALVTGASRGIGLAFARALLSHGAAGEHALGCLVENQDPDPWLLASKAAEWSLTNALRLGLREQGTQVVAVHVGYVDTDATKRLDVPKVSPAEVADKTMDAIIRDDSEVLVDERGRPPRPFPAVRPARPDVPQPTVGCPEPTRRV
jgi:NAD(P)-dependent dehydrogenase (short-subunit alcohol dehydrogenase family)